MRNLIYALPLVLATQALAQCPPASDITVEATGLLSGIQNAPNEMTARELSNELWRLWADAPDDTAQEMLDRGMQAIRYADFERALHNLNELVAYCPDYAEGYNQRAYANFLQGRFAPALEDLDRAIERSPLHVAAIAGKALTLAGLGREDEAQSVLREALALNPWLPERRYLKEPVGEDL